SGRLNYIRNSVKVVTDAYDGTISYYIVDDKDPVVRNLRGIYPSLFKPISEMPQALRDHIRYPESLFTIQTQVYALYHMTNPDDFYNRSDAWKVASEVLVQGGASQPIEPYYVTTRLPGSSRPEFVLFVPMTPAGGQRNNMVGWIAGRADAPDYGKLRVLSFPSDRPAARHDPAAHDLAAAAVLGGRRSRAVGDRSLQRRAGGAQDRRLRRIRPPAEAARRRPREAPRRHRSVARPLPPGRPAATLEFGLLDAYRRPRRRHLWPRRRVLIGRTR